MKAKFSWEKLLENLPAKILSVAAAVLLFVFNRIDTMQERFFSAPITIVSDSALTPGDSFTRRVKITLRGSEEVIFPIQEEDIEASVDFSGHQTEGVYRAPIRIIRKGTALDAQDLEINVEPIEMTLRMERKAIKSLEVVPKFSGQPSRGFEIDTYKLTPSFVTIEGPASHVEKLTQASTESIDLRGKKEAFTARVRLLNEDPLLSFPGGNVVEFQASIKEMLSTQTWETLPVAASGIIPGLRLSKPLDGVRLKIKGNLAAIESIKEPSTLLWLDLSDLQRAGEYHVKVSASLPPEVEILELNPETLKVVLEKSEP